MRIISQNHTVDVPYDNVIVYVHSQLNQIYVKMYVSGIEYSRDGFSIGKYNSKEDAKYVMSMIREAAIFGKMYFYMPEAKKVSTIREGEQE